MTKFPLIAVILALLCFRISLAQTDRGNGPDSVVVTLKEAGEDLMDIADELSLSAYVPTIDPTDYYVLQTVHGVVEQSSGACIAIVNFLSIRNLSHEESVKEYALWCACKRRKMLSLLQDKLELLLPAIRIVSSRDYDKTRDAISTIREVYRFTGRTIECD